MKNRRIRAVFLIILGFLGIQMILRGLGVF